MRIATLIVVVCLAIFATSCENGKSVQEQIDELRLTNTQLTQQIEQSDAEKARLKKQIGVLAGLEPKVRFEHLYDLQQVKITRYTGLYDKDKDGKKEKLIVYLQPFDKEGDIVKATGAVDVQLWDLNKEQSKALVGQWRVEPDELKKLWFSTLVTINYRLTFDVSDKVETFEEPLTVKVTFTDYLSGKVFDEQKVIKP